MTASGVPLTYSLELIDLHTDSSGNILKFIWLIIIVIHVVHKHYHKIQNLKIIFIIKMQAIPGLLH